MTRIMIVDQKVDFRKVFAALANTNLQSAMSHPDIGTVIVVNPNDEEATIALLQSEFGQSVTVDEAQLFVPSDWTTPGFINETLQGNEAYFVITSGLGLLLLK